MACDCIDKLEQELKKARNDDEAFIFDAVYDLRNKVRRFDAKGMYRHKHGGRYMRNYSSVIIPFDYCPFCGKKYIEEANNG